MGFNHMEENLVADLIYDVGIHKGEDTDYYLKKGFRVVAIEADPDLAASVRDRFAMAIASRKLQLIEGAIVRDPSVAHVSFWKNDDITTWGTIDRVWAEHAIRRGTSTREIRVAPIDFAATVRDHGVPYYMKIDVEGADDICLNALSALNVKPRYISVETDVTDPEGIVRQMDLLVRLGYDRFRAVQQGVVRHRRLPLENCEGLPVSHRFERGSSGPFGRDLSIPWTNHPGILSEYEKIRRRNATFGEGTVWRRWRVLKPIKNVYEWLLDTKIPGWYDTHAQHRDYAR
jgi:FkbM family methyltransferase